MNTSSQSPLPTPIIVRPGYKLTRLFRCSSYDTRERFETYRNRIGRPPYFSDPAVGENLTFRGGIFLLDQADLNEYEYAFLTGAGLTSVEGLRISWHEEPTSGGELHSPEALALATYFSDSGYTIWPSSHALVVADHAFVKALSDILSVEQADEQAIA